MLPINKETKGKKLPGKMRDIITFDHTCSMRTCSHRRDANLRFMYNTNAVINYGKESL